jgi:hypothetical protein
LTAFEQGLWGLLLLRGICRCVLYGIRSAVYSATRLSPASAYGRQLLLYAATLSTPPTRSWRRCGLSNASADTIFQRSVCAPPHAHPLCCPGAWCVRRSGIKEEQSAIGRRGGQPRSRTHQAHGRTNPLCVKPPVRQTPCASNPCASNPCASNPCASNPLVIANNAYCTANSHALHFPYPLHHLARSPKIL